MATVRFGDFEWDEAKAASNLQKHHVSFVEAIECFLDPLAITAPDKDDPHRFVLIGATQNDRVLFVVSIEIRDRIRIISARKASPQQRKRYRDGT
ncbi:MAG: BrnT family toxin [Myxococcales bacterium]|nr:BrnT family toxin [Myxococcales bacterium]